jgi:hypothetical protein
LAGWTPGADAGGPLFAVAHPDGDAAILDVEAVQRGLVLGLAPSLPVRRLRGEGGGYRFATGIQIKVNLRKFHIIHIICIKNKNPIFS